MSSKIQTEVEMALIDARRLRASLEKLSERFDPDTESRRRVDSWVDWTDRIVNNIEKRKADL